MKVTKKILPKSEVEFTVEFSVGEAQPYVQRTAKEISTNTEIKGFRKGKAPYDIIKQQIGEAKIYEATFDLIVKDSYPKIISQENLPVVGQAKIDVIKLAPGNEIIYKATVAVLPKVTLGDYKKINSKKASIILDEKKFQRTLEDLQKMQANEILVTRPAQKGDKVIVDFDILLAGVKVDGGQVKKQPVILGETQLIPGFEENIIGLKKDESKKFNVIFPEKYYDKKVAGKQCVIELKVNEVYERQLPILNDEFAKNLRFDSLEKLKEVIRQNVLKELEEKEAQYWQANVVKEIINKSKIEELPEIMITEEVEKMFHEMEHELTSQRLKVEDYLAHLKKTEEEFKKELRPTAVERIKGALILREVAVVEEISVSKEEIDKEIENLRNFYQKTPEIFKKFDSPAFHQQTENFLIHKKIFERLASFIP